MVIRDVLLTDSYVKSNSSAERLFRAGHEVIPGGTSRQFYSFAPQPIYAQSGQGCWLTDVDGDRRVDCLNNMTALIHGHADPDVTAALLTRLQQGYSFSEPCGVEVELAALLVDRVPSVEKIHFRNSGTEAVMMAVKLARAFTGRDKIAKFEGSYHGYYDPVQMSIEPSSMEWGTDDAPHTVPSSAGLSQSTREDVLVLPNNNREAVERLLEQSGREIAALMVEPLSNRSGMPLPENGFYDFLREITNDYGILLIFDEVITYRMGPAGAQGYFDVRPDLTTFGKVIGGGFPIGAIGGRSDVMELLNPSGSGQCVISGGTYSGNPLSMTAGLETLHKLTAESFQRLDSMGQILRNNMNDILRCSNLEAQVRGSGSLFQIIPCLETVKGYRSIPNDPQAIQFLGRFHEYLMHSGVIISKRGLGCLSTAMDETIIEFCSAAFSQAVDKLSRE